MKTFHYTSARHSNSGIYRMSGLMLILRSWIIIFITLHVAFTVRTQEAVLFNNSDLTILPDESIVFSNKANPDQANSTEMVTLIPGIAPDEADHPVAIVSPGKQNRFHGNQTEILDPALEALENEGPTIEIWYGDVQNHGTPGQTQVWCDIPGNVSDADGIASFTYTLNGGSPVSLSIGPDNRRLVNAGDFIVDPAVSLLQEGANSIAITAEDNLGNISNKTITINYTSGQVWPLPYAVNWNTLPGINGINDVAHVIDGKWQLEDLDNDGSIDGIRTTEPGYDRLIGIGDITWTNYMVEVPVTIHNDMPGGAGVGVLLRWEGHTQSPVSCSQPQCGYEPLGEITWYRPGKLEFYELGTNQSRSLPPNVTHVFRALVETDPTTQMTTYKLKVWEEGTTVPDLSDWDLVADAGPSDLQNGSLMLISHQADVTFGNVTVTPGPLLISQIDVDLNAAKTEATITWLTNKPATSRVEYGPTAAYENGFEEELSFVTSHSITLVGLMPDETYHFRITGETDESEFASTGDRTFSTFTAGIVSDDFCDPTINTDVWSINELGSGTIELVGSGTQDAFLQFNLPEGTEHQMHESIGAPHLIQEINNADFEVELGFASIPQLQFQEQGVLIKEDNLNFLRCEFYHNGSEMIFYGRSYGVVENTYLDYTMPLSNPPGLYMRVMRTGDQWTISYSYDGSFSDGGEFTFTHVMTTTGIAVYGGNAIGTSSPAFTAQLDYFFNLDAPIIPEDNCSPVFPPVLQTIGNLTIEAGNTTQYSLVADDPDGENANLVFMASGLPLFATLSNLGDGTAQLDIDPLPGDVGTYDITVTVTDEQFLTDEEEIDLIITDPVLGVSGIHSDDFCAGSMQSFWKFHDPLEDGAALQFSGANTADARAEITVPAGVAHELYTSGIQAPHLIQDCNDVDFLVEVKFSSPVSGQYQEQGILIKQDDNTFLRFEFFSTSSETRILSAIFPENDITYNEPIGTAGIAPVLMRVQRSGSTFTQTWSADDGLTWNPGGAITTPTFIADSIGIYAGNAGNNPAHTGQFDYFLSLDNSLEVADAGGPYVINLGSGLLLDASGTVDQGTSCGDAIVNYSWDLDDDGQYDDAMGIEPDILWSTLNDLGINSVADPLTGQPNLPVRLQVENNFGVLSESSTTLTIYDNTPVADISATPNPAGCNQNVTFDGSASSHGRPDRSIVTYSWDFDASDGVDFNTPDATGTMVTHSYGQYGAYTATLRVTDDNVPAKTSESTVLINVNQGNQAPVANPGGPYEIMQNDNLQLDGSASSDPDALCGDEIISYAWLIDPDGMAISASGPAPLLDWALLATLPTDVDLDVQLTVTDGFTVESVPGMTSLRIIPVADLSGKLEIQGIPNLENDSHAREILVRVYSQGVLLSENPVLTDATGSFIISDIPTGTWDIWVKDPLALAVMSPVELVSPATQFDFGVAPGGDYDGNNLIDLIDFNGFAVHYGQSVTHQDWDPNADFNYDGYANLFDFTILASNYGTQGSTPFAQSGIPQVQTRSAEGCEVWITREPGECVTGRPVQVLLWADLGDAPVSGISFDLAYDTRLLSFQKFASSDAFPVKLTKETDQEGHIRVEMGRLGGDLTGCVLVGEVWFIPKANGEATLDFAPDGNNMLIHGGFVRKSNWNGLNLDIGESGEKDLDIQLFPVPASRNGITVQSGEMGEVSQFELNVISVHGTKLWSDNFRGTRLKRRIDLQDFENGMYYIEVRFNNLRSIRRFIVK